MSIYDVHGWLTGVVNGEFQERLYYADGLDGGCWNGNISTMKWRSGDNGSYEGYNLKYDGCNRLYSAVYGSGDNLTGYRNYFSENVEYDCEGNITRLRRCGLVDNIHGTFGLVDNLTMTYAGNMLASVCDSASRYPYAGATDFDGVPGQVYPLTYNDAGSLVSDAGRGIARIDYDLLNNPVRIQFTNGNVTKYIYSTAGEKLRVIHQTAVPNITVAIGSVRELAPAEILSADSTDYLLGGSLTLRNGRIEKLQFGEGYCQAEKYAGDNSKDDFYFYYYDRDHLGNIRQVVKADRKVNGTVVQTMDYYPFGAQFCHSSTASEVQSRKYNGKEFDKMHGLNTYDYGARQYNPVTARWDRMDPLCEKYYAISPYTYCDGNPVNRIDRDGRFWGDYLTSTGEFIRSDGSNDGRLYVLKTSKMEFDSYQNAPISGITIEDEKRVVENHDISNKDFFVEITGSQKIRETVVSKIKDNGKGGTDDDNNREYLMTFDKNIDPCAIDEVYVKEGPVGNLAKDNLVSVEYGNSPNLEYVHTHPSGTNGKRRWHQAPSRLDVIETTTQQYVIGMGDKTVYIYNGNGINATLPLDVYKNYVVKNGK